MQTNEEIPHAPGDERADRQGKEVVEEPKLHGRADAAHHVRGQPLAQRPGGELERRDDQYSKQQKAKQPFIEGDEHAIDEDLVEERGGEPEDLREQGQHRD